MVFIEYNGIPRFEYVETMIIQVQFSFHNEQGGPVFLHLQWKCIWNNDML